VIFTQNGGCLRRKYIQIGSGVVCPSLAPYVAAHMETAVIPGLSRLDEGRKADELCTIVIFGASW